jgi:prepilin-type N-terminal cleavage/methylation domain-containing protein
MIYCQRKNQKGFTLVELLVTLAIMLIVVASLSSTFVFQQKTYNAQQQINEMVQNARAGMDLMSSEMMMTGYGVATDALPLSNWLTWGSVTFRNDPVVIEDNVGDGPGGSNTTDIIHVAGCFDGHATTLSAAASAGDTTITVADAGDFNTTTKSNICINGIERAVVTAVSLNTLSIDTDPVTANDQGLLYSYPVQDPSGNPIDVPICVVKIISYSIVQETDGGNTVYTLKRNENLGAGRQPLAENIIDMQVSSTVTEPATINNSSQNLIISWGIDPLTARSDKPDPDYSQNSGYRTYKLKSILAPPNLKTRVDLVD